MRLAAPWVVCILYMATASCVGLSTIVKVSVRKLSVCGEKN